MFLLISVIGLVLLLIGIIIYTKWRKELYKKDMEWIFYALNSIGGSFLCIGIMVLLALGILYSDCITINEKINIYKKENAKIEQQMTIIVNDYMEYETETFEKFKNENEDAIALVTLFPELKTNDLVVKQIEVYVDNNNKIKELECERLKYKVYGWWLFFKTT